MENEIKNIDNKVFKIIDELQELSKEYCRFDEWEKSLVLEKSRNELFDFYKEKYTDYVMNCVQLEELYEMKEKFSEINKECLLKIPVGVKVNPNYYNYFKINFRDCPYKEKNRFYDLPISIDRNVETYEFVYEE